MTLDYYQILGIAPTATQKEIRAAYKRAARNAHPDRGGTHEAFIKIKRAYETLHDPVQREMYDLGARQGIDPREFQKILEGLTATLANNVLTELEAKGGYGNLRKALDRCIKNERDVLHEDLKSLRKKKKFVEHQLHSVKKGGEARLIQQVRRLLVSVEVAIKTNENNECVLDFFAADAAQIEVEAMMPPPGETATEVRMRQASAEDAIRQMFGGNFT